MRAWSADQARPLRNGFAVRPPLRSALSLNALAVLAALLVLLAGCSDPLAGSAGLGDSYLPNAGNGGYEVLHYDLDLTVDPSSGQLAGLATISAVATQDLSAFNLDFDWPGDVEAVAVDGRGADWKVSDGELKVACPATLEAQGEFTVSVAYAGTPKAIEDAGSFEMGWQHRGDLIFTLDEPEGASTWFPVNDHPSDKATYSFRITVPKPYVAAANGVLVATEDKGTDQTFVWEMKQPQASYLASVTIADYVVQTGESSTGVPIRNYFDPGLMTDAETVFERTGEVLDYFVGVFGPYPFEVYGVAVPAADTGAAMENQTLSLYGQDVVARRMTGDAVTREIYLAHELAHQWFGDSVTIERWQDIWLNEGFATYASWLWLEHDKGAQMMRALVERTLLSLDGASYPPLSDPGVDGLFSANVYGRGALTLHALRLTVGDQAFFTIVREWASRYQYGSVNTDEFISLVKEVATGVPPDQLTALFAAWLDEERRPVLPGEGW